MPTNELKLLLSVGHDRVRQTVEYARRWCVYGCENRQRLLLFPRFPFYRAFVHSLPPSNISTTLDRSLITILRHRTTKPTFRFGSRTTDREESRTKLHATSTTRSDSDRAEVAGLIEYQGTINALRGNIDTLAQILQYIVTTSRLTEIGRSDVKVSQVDPGLCQFRRGYYKIVRQHRTRYGRFSGLVD